ncbi:CHAP domain-containing protein [Actinophytocola xanthii]|uniref:CHAP domain-containing protein n=1 Tax=Actinophytocola xanthii TaxID=1912961 RepID=A0A1Q8CR77_9PSEU|nr:CHAP domain-containing protein [Actinophytocola xanthii]OLF16837.1 CHAP domain-containing protein [Actinophytocola xanthii]
MESRAVAREVAGQLIAHRNRLAGKADDAYRAQAALAETARALERHHDDHRAGAAAATTWWEGRNAAGFDRRARRLTGALGGTAAAAAKGAEIVAVTAASLETNHRAVAALVEEYTDRAARLIDAARAVSGAGARAALVRAAAEVADLVRNYTNESIRHVRVVQAQLKDAAEELRGLERAVERDGVVDPARRRRRGPDRGGVGRPPRTRSGLRNAIRNVARGELGYREEAGNRNRYGPTGPWCSNFATWVWRRAGVEIGVLPFTGDVYEWGRERGLAYGREALGEARPGDVLLFGTGPASPATSTHIGIVESVDGDTVTLIEGNSGDQVRRVTHTLSAGTFYGGVHPR